MQENIKKTYYVKSDYYTAKYIDSSFDSSVWKKISDTERASYISNKTPIDYIYLDGKHYYNPENFKLIAHVKNLVDDSKKSITSKNNLMANLAKIPAAAKFIMPQIELDLHTINTNGQIRQNEVSRLMALFKGDNKVYIFKPVTGFSGQGIRIVTSMQELQMYISQIIRENSRMWHATNLVKALYEKMRIWVLQEYLTDPLLITQNVKNSGHTAEYKFHIRHYLFYVPGKTSYYVYEGELAPARAPYMKGNWANKLIHDTHFYGRDGELFPTALGLSEMQTADIYTQISKLYSHILTCINANCYSESSVCYELFGVDLIITNDYKVKVIEINEKLGMPSSSTLMSQILFEGCLHKIVMPLLGLTCNETKQKTAIKNKYDKHFIEIINIKIKKTKQPTQKVNINTRSLNTTKTRKAKSIPPSSN